MKVFVFILAAFFLAGECHADSRVLERLRAQAHQKHKKKTVKHKKKKKTVHKKTKVKPPKPKEIVTSKELDFKQGVAYLPDSNKPFTGRLELHHSNGQKYVDVKYKNGKKNGSLTMWDEYGHKVGELYYDNDEPYHR